MFFVVSFIIVLTKDELLWRGIKERAISICNIALFFINAPLDILHDLLYDRINYETHLREYKFDRKREQFSENYVDCDPTKETGQKKNKSKSVQLSNVPIFTSTFKR